MNLQRSQRTSGVGALTYCASCFESPQILVIRLAGILLRAAPASTNRAGEIEWFSETPSQSR
jgi:hypothetical protein